MQKSSPDGRPCPEDVEKGLDSREDVIDRPDSGTATPLSEKEKPALTLCQSIGQGGTRPQPQLTRHSNPWQWATRKSGAGQEIDRDPPPDGGIQAWTVVVMCHMVGLNTWGFLNSFGVMQSYYVSSLGKSPSDISWIGSIQGFLLFFVSAFSGRLTDAGYFHQTIATGTALQLLGVFGASFSTKYWQLLLSHGICVGFGGGLIFIPALSLVATYFVKNRSLALALCACGNSVGGLFYAAVLQRTLPHLGFAWTMRVCGFVMAAVMIPANFLLKPRRIKRGPAPLVEWAAFKEPAYSFFSVGMFLCMLGQWVPVFYVGAPFNPS
jgi:MFS family permease